MRPFVQINCHKLNIWHLPYQWTRNNRGTKLCRSQVQENVLYIMWYNPNTSNSPMISTLWGPISLTQAPSYELATCSWSPKPSKCIMPRPCAGPLRHIESSPLFHHNGRLPQNRIPGDRKKPQESWQYMTICTYLVSHSWDRDLILSYMIKYRIIHHDF